MRAGAVAIDERARAQSESRRRSSARRRRFAPAGQGRRRAGDPKPDGKSDAERRRKPERGARREAAAEGS